MVQRIKLKQSLQVFDRSFRMPSNFVIEAGKVEECSQERTRTEMGPMLHSVPLTKFFPNR